MLLFIELQQAQVPESLAAKKLMYMRPRIVRGRAKYDDFRLSLRHQIKEKKFARGSERIPVKYAIATGTSKVKLMPWCCRLFIIHGFLALILFTVTVPF